MAFILAYTMPGGVSYSWLPAPINMNRNRLLSQLEGYSQRYPEELEVVRRFVRFVRDYESCFERSLPQGHVTGSAWVVNLKGDKTLLTHHRKLNRWLQLGGHADGESDIALVAQKEAEEESGLSGFSFVSKDIFDIDIHEIPARPGEQAHLHFDVRYLLRVSSEYPLCISSESNDLLWISLSALSDYSTERSVLRMAEKWLNVKDNGIETGRLIR